MNKTDKIMATATIVIAIGTLVSAGAICFQWYEMHVGGRDTGTIASASERNAKAAEGFSTSAAGINTKLDTAVGKLNDQAGATHDLAIAAKAQAQEARVSAEAALKAVQVSQQQLEVSQRPWLAVDFSVPGGVANSNGAAVDIRVRNVGHSPASNVVINAKIINRQGFGDVSEIDKLCLTFPKEVPLGVNVFPGDDWTEHFLLQASQEELSKSKTFMGYRADELVLHVIGCVTYFGSLSSQPHQTTFAYSLVNLVKDDQGTGVTFKMNVPVPGSQIRADRWPMGNDAK